MASTSSTEVSKAFATSAEVKYPILSDSDKAVARAYGVIKSKESLPRQMTFYIDATGVVRHIERAGSVEYGDRMVAKLKELRSAK